MVKQKLFITKHGTFNTCMSGGLLWMCWLLMRYLCLVVSYLISWTVSLLTLRQNDILLIVEDIAKRMRENELPFGGIQLLLVRQLQT